MYGGIFVKKEHTCKNMYVQKREKKEKREEKKKRRV